MLDFCVDSPKICTAVLIGHASCTNFVRAQPTNWQSCEQPKFSKSVLLVKTKDIVLFSQAVLILCVQSLITSTTVHKKVEQLCAAKN